MVGSQMKNNSDTILKAEGLTKVFEKGGNLFSKKIGIKAVDEVAIQIKKGEAIGLVGESGCGKSTLGRLIIRLYKPSSGTIEFDGQDISNLKESKLQPIRKNFQMVFQDPYASLNPRMTVKEIIEKPFKVHGISYSDKTINEIMEMVGLSVAFKDRYPHEFSGGQRQRVGIGRAIAMKPQFIVCDEPVSALDVSVQAQILNLLSSLKKDLGLTYLFISHDLSVVKHISDRIAVMYLGNIVEIQDKDELYKQPHHPYSQALLSAIPIANPFIQRQRQRVILKGDVPSPINPPKGCSFHPRCPYAKEKCKIEKPIFREIKEKQFVACHYPILANN